MYVSSAHFVSATAPTASVTLLLYMDNNIHVPALEKLDRAFAHILEICGLSGDDVDDTKNPLLSGTVSVVVIMVVVIVCMRMVVVMIMS